MYSSVVLSLLLVLTTVYAHPTPNAGECTKEQLEEKNRCEKKVESSTEFLSIKVQLQTAILQCIPTYPSDCTKKNELADNCLEQLELDVVQNKSLSSDEKRKTLLAINNCLPSFTNDFWGMMEDKLRQHASNGQQQVTSSSTASPSSTTTGSTRTPALVQQVNFGQILNIGNDQCIPTSQQLSCLIDNLVKDNKIIDISLRVLEQQKQCDKTTSANCQFKDDINVQDCSNNDMKPIVDQLKIRLQECVAQRG